MKTRITATITFDVVTEDDAGLDDVCADIHAQIDMMLADSDWTGSAVLDWQTVGANTAAPAAAPGGRDE